MDHGGQSRNENVMARTGHERRASLRTAVAFAALLACLGAGCSESSSTQTDGGSSNDVSSTSDAPSTSDVSSDAPSTDAPSTSDVSSTSDGAATDTTPADASSMDDHLIDATPAVDGDAGCECSVSTDAGGIPIPTGILSIPCYCAKQDWRDGFDQRPTCPSYDDAVECTDAARSFHIRTYKNCNFVTVFYDVFNAVDMRVYDATSHELVGALRGTDSAVSSCDARIVGIVQSGVVPGPECEIAQEIRPCDKRDAGDGGDADGATNDAGACACTLTGANPPIGHVSLGCYCGSLGSCPGYREAVAWCAAPASGANISLEEYAGCNLSVVRVMWPSVFQTYLYDFTTHELVGVTSSSRGLHACGDGETPVFHAGATTIDASCVRTRYVNRCPDRGDASIED